MTAGDSLEFHVCANKLNLFIGKCIPVLSSCLVTEGTGEIRTLPHIICCRTNFYAMNRDKVLSYSLFDKLSHESIKLVTIYKMKTL